MKDMTTFKLQRPDVPRFCECLETVARFSVGQTLDMHFFFVSCLSPELDTKTRMELFNASRSIAETSRDILFYQKSGHDFNKPLPKMLMGIRSVILNAFYADQWCKPASYPYWHDNKEIVTATNHKDGFVIGLGNDELFSAFGIMSAIYRFAIHHEHEPLADWIAMSLPGPEETTLSSCCDSLIKMWVDLLAASYDKVEEPDVDLRRWWPGLLDAIERIRIALKEAYHGPNINQTAKEI